MGLLNAFVTLAGQLARGVGQVMFQSSTLSGLIMLCGILCGAMSWGGDGRAIVFLGAVAGLVVSSAIAFLKHERGSDDGLYGFNGVLVGCAAFTFLDAGAWAWVLLLAASVLTIPLKNLLDRLLGVSSFTFPFVIASWLMLAVGLRTGICTPYLPEVVPEPNPAVVVSVLVGLLKGVSEVFLIDSWLTGLIFLAALYVASPKAALLALVGSASGMVLAFLCACPSEQILGGLWGFSPALTAIAVGSVIPIRGRRTLWIAASLVLTFIVQYTFTPLFAYFGLPILTFPFCVAACLSAFVSQRVQTLRAY